MGIQTGSYGKQFEDFTDYILLTTVTTPTITFTSVTEKTSGAAISGITVSNSGVFFDGTSHQTTFTVTGQYGASIAANDSYVGVNTTSQVQKTYTTYESFIAAKGAEWDIVSSFVPDGSNYKTAVYTFTVNNVVTNIEHPVHLIPTRHFTRLNDLLNALYPSRVIVDSNGNIVTPSFSTNIVPTPTIDFLVVAGGGAGGGAQQDGETSGGGGGAGGIRQSVGYPTAINQAYTITVGAGGAGGYSPFIGANGSNSSIVSKDILLTATGGGGGTGVSGGAARSGGSGGGGARNGGIGGLGNLGGYTPSEGNNGATGTPGVNGSASGGGGAGGAGVAGFPTSGNGGIGIFSSISGSNVAYGGGGAASLFQKTRSFGGGGYAPYGSPWLGTPYGGGNGAAPSAPQGANGSSGTSATGGGGGGAEGSFVPGSPGQPNQAGGNGGSGIVIIRFPTTYPNAASYGAEYSESGGNRIFIYKNTGNFYLSNSMNSVSFASSNLIDYVVVGGGGAGGPNFGGGGGAGGYITGLSAPITPGTIYTVVVGAGGVGVGGQRVLGTSGSNSGIFNSATGATLTPWAIGGGYGSYSGDQNDTPARDGVAAGSGGSGGGAGATFNSTINPPSNGAGTPGQGFDGGITSASNPGINGNRAGASGGGGAGAPGGPSGNFTVGAGGVGTTSPITGTRFHAGGGGGGGGGAGGNGGGGAGAGAGAGTSGTTNTGGGGGGGGGDDAAGGNGGSGVVIIRYPLTSPNATTVGSNVAFTIAGLNRVITFNASGTITF